MMRDKVIQRKGSLAMSVSASLERAATTTLYLDGAWRAA
jgi:hypothetical protein